MKTLKKVLKWAGVVVVVLVIVAIIAMSILMRVGRHQVGQVKTVHGGVVQASNSMTYIYGVESGDKILIIDGGIDERGDALDALLSQLGVTRDQVTDVFLTHGHYDHVALAPLCKQARIHLGTGDIAMAAKQAPQEPRMARWLGRLSSAVPAVNVTDPLVGRTEFDFDGEKLLALPLPGHTPGSYIFVWKGVLFAGDSIHIMGDKLGFAQGVFSLDLPLSRKGIAQLRDNLGTTRVDMVCTGHEGCTSPADTGLLIDDLVKRASLGQE